MDKLITIWSFICRRKYLITVVAFAVIIGFLDENSLFRVWHTNVKSAN